MPFLQTLISTYDAIAIPIWSSAKGSIPRQWLLPTKKKLTKSDSLIEEFVGSAITVDRYRRLVTDTFKVWQKTMQTKTKAEIMLSNASNCQPAPEQELTTDEEVIVKAILKASPPSVAKPRGNEGALVANALASTVLFYRGPGKEIYTLNDAMIKLRIKFTELMSEFTLDHAKYTYPDGMNNPALVSALEKQANEDIIRRRRAIATLQARVNDVTRIDWASIVDFNTKSIPAIKRVVRDFLQVCVILS